MERHTEPELETVFEKYLTTLRELTKQEVITILHNLERGCGMCDNIWDNLYDKLKHRLGREPKAKEVQTALVDFYFRKFKSKLR